MFSRRCLLLIVALLAIASVSIAWHLATANYPTHSDVFFMGVEAGILTIVLLICLVLMGVVTIQAHANAHRP